MHSRRHDRAGRLFANRECHCDWFRIRGGEAQRAQCERNRRQQISATHGTNIRARTGILASANNPKHDESAGADRTAHYAQGVTQHAAPFCAGGDAAARQSLPWRCVRSHNESTAAFSRQLFSHSQRTLRGGETRTTT
jgi:hypothetical protein